MNESPTISWAELIKERSVLENENQTLIDRCLDGDESAFLALYNQYNGLVYRLAYGLLNNKEDAEEVLQDSFEYAFRKLGSFDPHKSAFKTWLYRITVSRARNKRRRKWLPTLSLSLLDYFAVKDEKNLQPDESLELNDQQKEIWRALSGLSPKLRETAVLRYYHGLRYGEIGEILGISPKTAESRMRLAHKALKERLNKEEIL